MSTDARDDGSFLESLTETSLYSIGGFFCDNHPDLVDEVIGQSEAIERDGLERWARKEEVSVEQAFQTLVTGLAVRYFTAGGGARR